MKASINIEFILSVVVFLGAISFVTINIINVSLPFFHKEAVNDELKSKAFHISELLLFKKGVPGNWDETNVRGLGLSSGEPYIIEESKILALNDSCSNDYQGVLGLLYQKNIDVVIDIIDLDGNNLCRCGPMVSSKARPEFSLQRIAVLDNVDKDIVKMTVRVVG